MLMAFNHYKAGFLPGAGGWMDQPYTFTESMRFIDGQVKHHEKADLDG